MHEKRGNERGMCRQRTVLKRIRTKREQEESKMGVEDRGKRAKETKKESEDGKGETCQGTKLTQGAKLTKGKRAAQGQQSYPTSCC